MLSEGEKRLLMQILLGAMKDYNNGHRRKAELWFKSKNREPFSFLFICSKLNLNDKVILKGLDNLPKRIRLPN